MGKNSAIEWCDHTFNIAWGCTKVSPGCKHCYAETLSNRYLHDVWGPNKPRRIMSDSYWMQPVKWNKEAETDGIRKRVFCGSMCDVFEHHNDLVSERQKLWVLIDETPWLDWLLLTKRPENIKTIAPWWNDEGYDWPKNVWIGTSVENQEYADIRIPILLTIPAKVRFLSCEPLLGPVNLRSITFEHNYLVDALTGKEDTFLGPEEHWGKIHWVIVGGESGPKSRPMHPDWARSIRGQCQKAGTPFFFKQWGEHYPSEFIRNGKSELVFHKVGKKAAGAKLDGLEWQEFPEVEVTT